MGEPLLHPELPDFIAMAKKRGFRSVLTTNGTLLHERGEALLQAGLPAPCTRNDTKASARYQEEVEHQKVVYRQRKAEKKLRAQKRMAQKAAGKKNGGQSGSG